MVLARLIADFTEFLKQKNRPPNSLLVIDIYLITIKGTGTELICEDGFEGLVHLILVLLLFKRPR